MISDIRNLNGKLISEAVFLAAFSLFLIILFLDSTTFTIGAPVAVTVILRSILFCVGIYRFSLFKDEINKPALLTVAVFFALGLFFLKARQDFFVLDMAVVMMGACKVPFKRIGSIYLFVSLLVGVLAFICSSTGVIPDYVFYTDIGSKTVTRHSFGIIYPTDLFAHLFYAVVVYLILRWKRITYLEISLLALTGGILFCFTGARADFACLIMVLLLATVCKICKYKEMKIKDRIKVVCGAMIMPVGAFTMILLTWFFKPYNLTYSKIDSMMTQRLSLGRTGFDLYGFTPLGAANFAENGNSNGGIMKYDYVFYDSSYIKMLFKYGYVVLFVVLVIFALIAVKLVKEKMFYAIIFIAGIALSCVIEHHIFELSYNLAFLLLTADMSSCLQSDPLIIINNKKMV